MIYMETSFAAFFLLMVSYGHSFEPFDQLFPKTFSKLFKIHILNLKQAEYVFWLVPGLVCNVAVDKCWSMEPTIFILHQQPASYMKGVMCKVHLRP